MRPQPHVSEARVRREAPTRRSATSGAQNDPARTTAIAAVETLANWPDTRTANQSPLIASGAVPRTADATDPRVGTTSVGPTPKTTQAVTSVNIATRTGRLASWARAAASLRG